MYGHIQATLKENSSILKLVKKKKKGFNKEIWKRDRKTAKTFRRVKFILCDNKECKSDENNDSLFHYKLPEKKENHIEKSVLKKDKNETDRSAVLKQENQPITNQASFTISDLKRI